MTRGGWPSVAKKVMARHSLIFHYTGQQSDLGSLNLFRYKEMYAFVNTCMKNIYSTVGKSLLYPNIKLP